MPGPAAYGKGGDAADRDRRQRGARLSAGRPARRRDAARSRGGAKAVQTIADALGVGLMDAAQGIVDIVNENMFGALRLVSVEQGYDPRDFALVAFGGAGPLHANALGMLLGCWPVIIPPSPGVLCAYGDATTRLRNEASRTFIRPFSATTARRGDRSSSATLKANAPARRSTPRACRAPTRRDRLSGRRALPRPGPRAADRRRPRRLRQRRTRAMWQARSTRCISRCSPSRSTPRTRS